MIFPPLRNFYFYWLQSPGGEDRSHYWGIIEVIHYKLTATADPAFMITRQEPRLWSNNQTTLKFWKETELEVIFLPQPLRLYFKHQKNGTFPVNNLSALGSAQPTYSNAVHHHYRLQVYSNVVLQHYRLRPACIMCIQDWSPCWVLPLSRLDNQTINLISTITYQ